MRSSVRKKRKNNLSTNPSKNKASLKLKTPNVRAACAFFAEAGLLKHVKRSGWWVAGIKDPESVAEHCFRTAIIAHYIAHAEGADPYKTVMMALYNDIHEARINDLHKMGHYYIDFKQAERKVFRDQVKALEEHFKNALTRFREAYEAQQIKESIIARDADILECLLQAREYLDGGHLKTRKFFHQAPAHLHTKTARKLWRAIKTYDTSEWWERVVKFER